MNVTLRKIGLWTLLAAAIAAAAAWTWRGPLSMALASRLAERAMAADAVAALPDGLHVGLCGAGSPFPDEKRAGPCTLVVAGRRMFVFDAGSGSARSLVRMGFSPGRIDAIFLTHFHSDHIDGLGELLLQRWVQSEAAGADLLVHEALSPTLVRVLQDSAARAGRKNLQKIFGDILDYHATPEEAAAVARDAKVGMLLLNHIVPALPVPGMEQTFVGDAAKIYSGPIHVGNDGDFVSLPAGSGAIEFGRRGTL